MQTQDVVPILLMGASMFAVTWLVGQLQINVFLLLILQILVGAVVYIGVSAMFRLEPFYYLLRMLKNKGR